LLVLVRLLLLHHLRRQQQRQHWTCALLAMAAWATAVLQQRHPGQLLHFRCAAVYASCRLPQHPLFWVSCCQLPQRHQLVAAWAWRALLLLLPLALALRHCRSCGL
jgi:hypothetical protein